MKRYYVYILTSKKNGTLYTGVTNSLVRRISEHKNKINEGFTKKYNVSRLVYYEEFSNIADAILREKRIKKWKRQWKIELIETLNPQWIDLYNDLHF
jgi:putative endonuclease